MKLKIGNKFMNNNRNLNSRKNKAGFMKTNFKSKEKDPKPKTPKECVKLKLQMSFRRRNSN